jgi:hypothetical protein
MRDLIRKFREIWRDATDTQKLSVGFFFGILATYILLFGASIFMGWWHITLPMFVFVVMLIGFGIYNYKGAPYNIGWFTTIREGTGKEIAINGNFVDFIPNRKGVFYNRETHKIEPAQNREDEESLLTKHTGLYFIGWNPLRKVREFDVLTTKLQEDLDHIENIKDMVKTGEIRTVDHLRMVIERSTLMLDVDLKDRTRLYVLVQGIYDVYDPYRILEELNGNFYSPLQGVVRAAILAKYGILQLPDLGTVTMTLEPQDLIDQGVKEIAGLVPASVKLMDWSLSEKDLELQNAAQQKRIQEEKAAGREAEGKGEAAYQLAVGAAKATNEKLLDEAKVAGDILYLERLSTAKLSPQTAEILAFQQISGLRTLVKGGNASVMLPAYDEDASTKRTPQTPYAVAAESGAETSSSQPSPQNS